MLVATFNMKNSYLPVSSKNWIKRSDAAIKLIRKRALDVIGTQELTPRTKCYLENKLDEYLFVGESRGSFGISDEYNSILFKKEVFELLEMKTYSLSNDIYKKGGKFLLDFFPRICTIAHVIYEDHKYLVINTHLDNLLPHNRKLQLEVITKIIKLEKVTDEDIIVIGDFNMHLSGNLKKFEKENNLVDTIPITFGSSFRTFDIRKPIDHIFIPKNTMNIIKAEYDTNKYDGISPSDHYPTVVEVVRKK